jgi:Condensation domain
VTRHAALRTKLIRAQSDQGVQSIVDAKDVKLLLPVSGVVVQDGYEPDKALMKESRHVFRLDQDNPIRAKIFSKQDSRVLSLVIHHTALMDTLMKSLCET